MEYKPHCCVTKNGRSFIDTFPHVEGTLFLSRLISDQFSQTKVKKAKALSICLRLSTAVVQSKSHSF